MKKTIFLLTLLFSFSLVAQRSLRVFNLNVKRGYESSVVETFSDFSSGEKWKSGGVMLQAVRFKNGVTHRIVVWGDPENWGTERERTDEDCDLYLERMNNFTYPNTADSAMGSILAFTEGDWKKIFQQEYMMLKFMNQINLKKHGIKMQKLLKRFLVIEE